MQKILHPQPIEQKPLTAEEPPLRPMEEKGFNKKSVPKIIYGVFIVLVLAGIGTGYLLSRGGSVNPTATVISGSGGKAFGSTDTKTFTDTAVGTIEKDGINDEGTHKLIRDGGPTQTACMVSSVLDLNEFVGKKVKVYGTTMAAKQCPWFMDVGRIELQ